MLQTGIANRADAGHHLDIAQRQRHRQRGLQRLSLVGGMRPVGTDIVKLPLHRILGGEAGNGRIRLRDLRRQPLQQQAEIRIVTHRGIVLLLFQILGRTLPAE